LLRVLGKQLTREANSADEKCNYLAQRLRAVYARRRLFGLRTVALLMLCARPLLGGVILDGSFGTHGALPGPNFMITAPMGKQVGGNLFQSFSQFNLNNSQSATFTGPSNVHNILARVTSGSRSSIDGTVRSDIQGANLFFMNPAGVLFGQHAQLDVSGSFAVTTANYLKLAGGGRFNANLGGGDVLTSAPVSAFGFLNAPPASVTFQQAQLNVAANAGLRVVGGDVSLDGASLIAPGGMLAIVSLGSGGQEVPFDVTGAGTTSFSATGHINFSNSSVAAINSTTGGGALVIAGGDFRLDNSTVSAINAGPARGGDISVQIGNDLSLLNGGQITASAMSSGAGGMIDVHASSLTVDGDNGTNASSIRSRAISGSGNAGNLDVVADEITLSNGGFISGSSFSAGHGADVTVTATSIDIFGTTIVGGSPGIFASANGTGDGGNIIVESGQALTIKSGGAISVAAASTGNGGNASIHAGSLSIDGSATPNNFTGIGATSNPGASGNGGNLTIAVDDELSIVGGAGEISTTTFSAGKGGNVSIHAGSVSIEGSATTTLATGIFADSASGATGNAGDLTIVVDRALTITRGGEIGTDTFSAGKGGDASIHAGSLSITGSAAPNKFTGIAAVSNPGASGHAGNLTITVNQEIGIFGGGLISTSTFSTGQGGNASIHAGSISIDGSAAPDKFTGIAAQTSGAASGGDLTVIADQELSIVGHGEISTATFSAGKGGDVTVRAGSLLIDGSATPDLITGIVADSESGATGNAGDLNITVDHALTVVGSGQVTADTYSSGKGGNLTIHAGSLLVDGSAAPDFITGISADAVDGTGNGGDLTISVAGLLKVVGTGSITADTYSSGKGGNLTVHARSLLVDGSGSDFFTGISADAVSGTGNSGDLTITVNGLLTIVRSGIISTDTSTSGKGGDVNIRAGSILIDGSAAPDFFTGISAEADAGTGDGGSVEVSANDILVKGGGSISASSFTSAPAGSVQVTAESMRLSGMSDISSFNADGGTGLAGSVVIHTSGSIILNGASDISTLSDLTDAGSIDIISGGEIKVKDQSSITVSAGHNGGDIHITAPDLVYLLDSSITATAGTSGVSGSGGNITIDSGFIVLNNSLISANAAEGQGGNINLVSDFLFNSDLSNNNITATGTTNGTVNITAPQLDLGSELITLPTSLLSAESQLQERCTALLRGDFSSFISIGRGGTEPAPEELQSTF